MIGFWKWGFRATVKVECNKENSPKITKSTTLSDLVANGIASLKPSEKLWLNPFLFNGTLQTINYATSKLENHNVFYGREVFTYVDGGICSLDWVIPSESKESFKESFKELYAKTLPEGWPRLHPRTRFFTTEEQETKSKYDQKEDTSPICVVFHGLAGGSHEPLIRNLADCLMSQEGSQWDVVVVNSRGCCRTKITLGKLFTALSYSDIGEVLEELKRRYPNRPTFTVGFSFGAALLTNYLGAEAEKSKELVLGAVLIGCPWDMAASARHLESSLSGRYLFNPQLTMFLNKLVKSNYAELKSHTPEIFNDENVSKAWKAKRTYQWDNIFTCQLISSKDSWEYYHKASPINNASSVPVPTLIINSTDDPAVAPIFPDVTQNSNLALVQTNLGGHLGWAQYSGEFWCVEVADDFMNQLYKLKTQE